MSCKLEVDVGSAVLSYRPAAGEQESVTVGRAELRVLYSAAPWRTFRWYKGQRHYSGWYWAATERDLVIHESRLELAALMTADYAKSVRRIVAQPFMLQVKLNGKTHRHIPDYLFETDDGPVVLDVTRRDRLENPKAQLLFEWTAEVMRMFGWAYGVYTEPDPMQLMNIRFLTGYRRDWLINREIYQCMHDSVDELVGLSFGQVEQRFAEYPGPLVRSTLFHLLWRHELDVDIGKRLSPNMILQKPS